MPVPFQARNTQSHFRNSDYHRSVWRGDTRQMNVASDKFHVQYFYSSTAAAEGAMDPDGFGNIAWCRRSSVNDPQRPGARNTGQNREAENLGCRTRVAPAQSGASTE